MKKVKIRLIVCLTLIVVSITLGGVIQEYKSQTATNSEGVLSVRADPIIVIRNNSAFEIYTSIGDGSEVFPYVLKDLIIDGNSQSDTCIDIQNTNAHFIIQNCTLYDGDYGIHCQNVSNGQFLGNRIYSSGVGIYLEYTNQCQALDNIIKYCDVGIYYERTFFHTAKHNVLNYNNIGLETEYTYYLTAENNTCNHITGGQSFYLWGVNHSIFTGNYAINCSAGQGFYIDDSCWNNTFTANYVSNCSYGVYMVDNCKYNWFISNEVHYTLDGYGWQIGGSGELCSYNWFITNGAYHTQSSTGFYLENAPHCILNGNVANYNGDDGIHLEVNTYNTTLLVNVAFNNSNYGIHLEDELNTLISNSADNNTQTGIFLEYSDNNFLTTNTANGNLAHGIYLHHSNHNNLSLNTAYQNGIYGFFIEDSDNNNVSWNVAHENPTAVIESGAGDNIVANNSHVAAILTGGTFTPAIGDTNTLFNFTVIYTDIDNNRPFEVNVVVGGVKYALAKQIATDNDYKDGCVYTLLTALPKGPTVIYFEAYDITWVVTTGSTAGPNVKSTGGIPGFEMLFILAGLVVIGILHRNRRNQDF